jgi:UDP-N-acetylmuramate: L-alanyl-gamma-D-glutamyl-meso-diaminopimelate ligase
MFAHKKHIHFIGICGVAMSALAILWHKKGWRVTGSDAGFYPPVSTHLEKNHIEFYPGWHPEKMGTPDLVVVGNVASSENPELQHVLKNNIPHLSYPELVAQNLIKKNSIVCAGTYGKTSSTTLLTLIFRNAGLDPAYLIGGLSVDLEDNAGNPENTEWSIVEGDEYKTSRDNPKAKFFSYKPTHLLLTSVNWDHADVYKTEEDYFQAFRDLITMIPEERRIFACTDNDNVQKILSSKKFISYGQNSKADYQYSNIKETQNGLSFDITHNNQTFHIESPALGAYMAENTCGAFALAHSIGIDPEIIISTLKNFHGLKRRLEKRGTVSGAPVFDDIAHSPTKAQSILKTLQHIYPGKIYAIFEPNIGNRKITAIPLYDHAFDQATEVIIPRLSKLKINLNDPTDRTIEGGELAEIISRTHSHTTYFEDDTKLIDYLRKRVQHNDVVVFMGSHGFRGMIEELARI